MAPARDDEFLPEVWGLYSVGTLWLLLRFAVRLRTDGIRGLRLDDGLAFVALGTWTFTCAIIHITYYTGTNTDFTPAEIATFDQAKTDEVVLGSKLFLGTWYSYLVLIFTLKGIVLILYHRIFFEPWQKWVLKMTTAICVLGFTTLTVALSLRCLPYHKRWQLVPRPDIACTASPNILITASCVNAVTDIFLLSVPISLLWNLNKPLRSRIAVFLLLASGVFVLAACITRVTLTVVPNIFVLNIARWGVREFCIGIVAVNTAALRPMFRRSFWTNAKPGLRAPQKRNMYVFASAQRARQRLHGLRHGSQVLDSTSAGASTVDVYVQRELGGEEFVFEDPEHQLTSVARSLGGGGRVVKGGGVDVDLEKGGVGAVEEISREDSAFSRQADGGDGEGRAGSGDTLSVQSRR